MKRTIFLFLAILLLVSCQSKPMTGETFIVEGGSYQNVTADELNTMLKNKDFMFVNVHIPFAGNITGTDLSIPYNQITEPAYLGQLPTDKSARIMLCCRSGRMSAIAAEELVSLGYTHIWTLTGGMVEWEQAGFELEE